MISSTIRTAELVFFNPRGPHPQPLSQAWERGARSRRIWRGEGEGFRSQKKGL